MADRESHRNFMDHMRDMGWDEYGATFTKRDLYDFLGLEVPQFGTQHQFTQIALIEVAVIDYCRDILLGEGKYLTQTGGSYRVLLPHENVAQVEKYMSAADRKLGRALKLSRNSPKQAGDSPSQTQARIMMKQFGLRERRNFRDPTMGTRQ
jgi:hypothetical protein